MTLTEGLSAAAARRRGIHTSREERTNQRRTRDFMDATLSVIRPNRQARNGRLWCRGRVSSIIVGTDVRRRISARTTVPPRYLGGSAACVYLALDSGVWFRGSSGTVVSPGCRSHDSHGRDACTTTL